VIDNHSSTIDHGELDQKLRLFGWDARTVDGRDHDQLRESLSRRSTDRPTAAIADIRQEGDS
jgi:transketolase